MVLEADVIKRLAQGGRVTLPLLLVSCLAGSLAAVGATVAPPETLNVAEITDRLTRAEQHKRSNLEEFSVVRRYVLKNSHFSTPTEMTVRLTYRQGTGKSFEVLSSNTDSGMSRRILDRVLEAEAESSRPNALDKGGLTTENYNFELVGTDTLRGRRCYVLKLNPKRKSKLLVQGKAWIDAGDYAVAKVEGHFAANLSFWVGKPLVVQEFQKYGDFWMASHNHTISESRLLGKSELTIDYANYSVHGVEMEALAARNRQLHRAAAN